LFTESSCDESSRIELNCGKSEQAKVVVAIGDCVEHVPKRSPAYQSHKTCRDCHPVAGVRSRARSRGSMCRDFARFHRYAQ
jgi:hypothetical protein